MGNFLIQVYGPCILLVVLSWVSFWLNREATADRVSLGITTVLTMTFLGLEARTDLPKVPYPTALDFFVFMSFGFIFATILQFAFVHYFTKYGSGECYFIEGHHSSGSEDEAGEECLEEEEEEEEEGVVEAQEVNVITTQSEEKPTKREVQLFEVIPLASFNSMSPVRKSSVSCTLWNYFCFHQNNKTHSEDPFNQTPSPAFISASNNGKEKNKFVVKSQFNRRLISICARKPLQEIVFFAKIVAEWKATSSGRRGSPQKTQSFATF